MPGGGSTEGAACDLMQSFDAILFPADGRPPTYLADDQPGVFRKPPMQPVQTTRLAPHPEYTGNTRRQTQHTTLALEVGSHRFVFRTQL